MKGTPGVQPELETRPGQAIGLVRSSRIAKEQVWLGTPAEARTAGNGVSRGIGSVSNIADL